MVARCSTCIHVGRTLYQSPTIRTSIRFYSVYRIRGYVPFYSFFWASSLSSLAPAVEIGGIWHPKGIWVLDPWEIPCLNTPILLSSGAAVTWAHHAILAGKEKRAVYAVVVTVSLALKKWNIIKHPSLFRIVIN